MNTLSTINPYEGFAFLTKVVNRDFRIKVFGVVNNRKVNTLVGVAGLISLVGVDQANKLTARAFKNSYYNDNVVCKLRRGVQVTFYSK